MNPQIVPIHRKGSLQEEGMIFVRTDGILETMVKAHLIFAGLIVVAMAMPIQSSFSSTRTLDLIINSDGSTHVSAEIDVDSISSDFELSLFGPSVDNFVAMGENGSLLSGDIIEDKIIIDTLGSSSITINYDIHDLISKEGRVWTFSLDPPSDYSILMPENSVIIGMSVFPNNMEQINEQIKLELSSGPAQIDYIFGTTVESTPNSPEPSLDLLSAGLIIGPIIAASIVAAIILKKKQSKSISQIPKTSSEKQSESKSLETKTTFKIRSDIREDDQEIVKFISENGGQVFESDLRKKFLQPRTTMWRAVKRLERLGVVEIYKKDLQNMVKLRNDMEEEN
ncbi:MAG: MarR family transcriptional regulator [Nitrosopumilus sp.]|nr:MarR family transcriptional regulator [Nitrosopumilus sp.]MDC4231347.1 MarR family transcriptional regulator [Nitrosopumilus sp.]